MVLMKTVADVKRQVARIQNAVDDSGKRKFIARLLVHKGINNRANERGIWQSHHRSDRGTTSTVTGIENYGFQLRKNTAE